MKILVVAHGHPAIRKGGGEIAAYNQFKALARHEGVDAYFLAHCEEKRFFRSDQKLVNYKNNEYLFDSTFSSDFLSSIDHDWLSSFSELISKIKPDVIHFHHYFKIGLEAIGLARSVCGSATKIVLTLHEFLGICPNDGQMIKKNGSMCVESGYKTCTLCSPERSLQAMLLREAKIKNSFSEVDFFISPSTFLLDRYVAWGIPRDRIFEIENGYPNYERPQQYFDSNNLSFSFFGQFTPYKGLDLFIEAALKVNQIKPGIASFNVYGGGQQFLSGEFESRLASLKDMSSGIVNFYGVYDESNVVDLMSSSSVVVIPSKWWENSPVVIDECRLACVPMLVANHGGLKEKVVDKDYGIGFIPGSVASLTNEIINIIDNPQLIAKLRSNIKQPTSVDDIASVILNKYKGPL
jgi:glycosyltransferase involved in cell wall biosynthesis